MPGQPTTVRSAAPTPRSSLSQARASLALQAIRIREWIRLHGDHDTAGLAWCAVRDLECLGRTLDKIGQPPAELPLVRTGPGGDFTNDFQDCHVGSILDVHG